MRVEARPGRPAPSLLLACAACMALYGCVVAEPTTPLSVQEVASGLQNPLFLTSPPTDRRLFVVEQPGRIRIIKNGVLLATPFLDVTDRVSTGGERGLLSVAFHPRYAINGLLYVDYTDRDGNTRIERYTVSSNPDVADKSSATLILSVDQPFSNHNGGLVAFGPDGMLYIGMGDGGSAGDPYGNGQNLNTLLGKLLRIDVDSGGLYSVPPSNPFAGLAGHRGEIWAYGLRNPWRFAFDRVSLVLYIADVGQNKWEEIDAVPAAQPGVNYGWNIMEGLHCYGSDTCDSSSIVLPVLEYGHDDGCSVTGGYVYRGSRAPDLAGTYFYADYCEGWVRSFRYSGGVVDEEQKWNPGRIGRVLSFGEDADGELYILSDNGKVYKLLLS